MSAEKSTESKFTTITTEHYNQLIQAYIQAVAERPTVESLSGTPARQPDWEAEERLPLLAFSQELIDTQTQEIEVQFGGGETLNVEYTAETWLDEAGRTQIVIYYANANPDFKEFDSLRNRLAQKKEYTPEHMGSVMQYEIQARIRALYPKFEMWSEKPEQVNTDGKRLGCLKLYAPDQERQAAHVISLHQLKSALKDLHELDQIGPNEPSRITNTLARMNSTLRYYDDEALTFDGFFLRDVLDRAYLLYQDPVFGRSAAYRVLFNTLWSVRKMGAKGAEIATNVILDHFDKVAQSTPPQT